MIPGGPSRRRDLAGVDAAVEVELDAIVASADALASPVSARRAAVVALELVEAVGPGDAGWRALGAVVLGDVVTLRTRDGDEVSLVARRASVPVPPSGGAPLERVPAELAPLLARASGQGALGVREVVLASGDAVRLRATLEPARGPGVRAGRFVVRDDLAPVTLVPLASGR